MDDDDEFDIYDALGLNAPVSGGGSPNDPVEAYDPLAAFMDDEEEHFEPPVADLFSNQTEDGPPRRIPTQRGGALGHPRTRVAR